MKGMWIFSFLICDKASYLLWTKQMQLQCDSSLPSLWTIKDFSLPHLLVFHVYLSFSYLCKIEQNVPKWHRLNSDIAVIILAITLICKHHMITATIVSGKRDIHFPGQFSYVHTSPSVHYRRSRWKNKFGLTVLRDIFPFYPLINNWFISWHTCIKPIFSSIKMYF